MKHSCDVEIAAPRARVIELFDDPSNLHKWQEDLIRFEHLAGRPGRPGARSRLVYRTGKGEFEMIETVTERKLPDEFSGSYETKLGVTTIRNRFLDHGASTRWIVDTTYTPSGVMKVITLVMRGAIRKQTKKLVHAFKVFVESQPA